VLVISDNTCRLFVSGSMSKETLNPYCTEERNQIRQSVSRSDLKVISDAMPSLERDSNPVQELYQKGVRKKKPPCCNYSTGPDTLLGRFVV
jgi:hypothetical protein